MSLHATPWICRHVPAASPLDAILDERAKKRRKKGKGKGKAEVIVEEETPDAASPAVTAEEEPTTAIEGSADSPGDDDAWATNWVLDRTGDPEQTKTKTPAKPTLDSGGLTNPQATTAASDEAKEASVAKPKRKKVRSKQKNLRKDTRPDHLKPTYLTDGTKKTKLFHRRGRDQGRGGRGRGADGRGRGDGGRGRGGGGGGGGKAVARAEA